MLNFMKFGSPEPRFTSPMQKGGYHHSAVHSLLGNCLNPINGKQFPYVKTPTNLSVPNTCHNCPPTIVEEEREISSTMMQGASRMGKGANGPNYPCRAAKKKRKKKRRQKRKNKNQNQQRSSMTQMDRCSRERTMSVESEDSFVIFFNDALSEVSDCDTETGDFDSLESVIPNKKVRFASPSKLCEVHTMVVWSYAYQAARKGNWEEYARDRDRFRKRVRNTEALIGHVLAAEHRSKVYEERFSETP